MRGYSTNVLAGYSELVRRLQDDAVVEIGGKPTRRSFGGRDYWYAITRVGRKQVERYLGPDSDEMRARVASIEAERENLKGREKERGRLVRTLREAGLPSPDMQTGKILLALSRAGVFRLRGVLVGTHAYRCYPAILGVDLAEARAVTQDIDVAQFRAVSIAVGDRIDPELPKALRAIGRFQPRPSLYPNRPTAWRDQEHDSAVELLTPNQGPDRDEPVELAALGAYATPLRFLDFLIHEPLPAAVLYRYGVLVDVPQPARYAVHKLIVATRRSASARDKAEKDIRQAAELIAVLSELRPDELEDAWSEARDRGPRWAAALDRGARRLPRDARAKLEDLLGT
jgi:hypothetical protein